jgi:carbonic anhydrase
MHLFEAIIDANHRAVAGDASAGLHPAEFADALPVIALTCIDPRLNAFFPNALALPAEDFIWLRNAGNLITGPLTSTMRSLALACAIKGGREIAIIGHTDCKVCSTTTTTLLDKLKALGVERHLLPDNVNEFFGMAGSERQNIIKACDFARNSPLIGPKIPVHGLLLDVETGQLDWVVNGYENWQRQAPSVKAAFGSMMSAATEEIGAGAMSGGFNIGEMKFPESKIGETTTKIGETAAKIGEVLEQIGRPETKPAPTVAMPTPKPPTVTVRPTKIPLPPPIRPRSNWQR